MVSPKSTEKPVGGSPDPCLYRVQASGQQGRNTHDHHEHDCGVAALLILLEARTALWYMSPRPKTWVSTVITISGKPHTQSARHIQGLTARKLRVAWAILIGTSSVIHSTQKMNPRRFEQHLL